MNSEEHPTFSMYSFEDAMLKGVIVLVENV